MEVGMTIVRANSDSLRDQCIDWLPWGHEVVSSVERMLLLGVSAA